MMITDERISAIAPPTMLRSLDYGEEGFQVDLDEIACSSIAGPKNESMKTETKTTMAWQRKIRRA